MGHVKSKPVKGPGPPVQKPVEEKVLTREERIAEMEKQNVLNGRVFDPEILIEFSMSTLLDSISLQSWDHMFEAPTPYLHEPEVREFYYKMDLLSDGGVRTTVKRATKRGNIKRARLPKKFLRGEYQLMFEFINKALEPMIEKRNVASAADLFLIEKLDELEAINLPAIMLEHMHMVMTGKSAKHGIPYGYLLNHMFKHFEVTLGQGVPYIVKQMFTVVSLLECECVKRKGKG
ncbi:hypothetical protein KY290_005107 [Solanum tuberosum]|uniref:Uncharacterized protein n=1 Tax=Solanum tuberosum TaxID=4113 RepID=A0ABQ7WF90_SOLTU|nr:hypothetical protein KY290_005107 [Solanum tuberosum]